MTDDPRLHSTSAARNKDIIAEAFLRLLPQAERVLELASGTGEHAEAILKKAPALSWQASDPDPDAQRSSTARMTSLGQPQALSLDTRNDGWWTDVFGPFDALVAINMIHITSRRGYEELFRGASALLRQGGALFLYGPMKRRGVTEESNLRFDASLKARDPEWGLRDLDDTLQPLAARFAMELAQAERVPANNHIVVFKKMS